MPMFLWSCSIISTNSVSVISWKLVTFLSTPLLNKLLQSHKEYIQILFASQPNLVTEPSKPSF